MALHIDPTEEQDGNYFGPTLNRVARLLSAVHGGQTLLSLATKVRVCDRLPPGVSLRNPGECLLEDLIDPEQVFQVVAPGLPANFPPLKTLDARLNNLPLQPTSPRRPRRGSGGHLRISSVPGGPPADAHWFERDRQDSPRLTGGGGATRRVALSREVGDSLVGRASAKNKTDVPSSTAVRPPVPHPELTPWGVCRQAEP